MRLQKLLEYSKFYKSILTKIITICTLSIIVYFLTVIYTIFFIFILSRKKLFIKNKRRNFNLRRHYKKIRLNPKYIRKNRSNEKPNSPDTSEISTNTDFLDLKGENSGLENQISDNSTEINQANVDFIGTNMRKSGIREELMLSVIISNIQLFSRDKNKKWMKYFVCHLKNQSALLTSSIIEGKLRETVRFIEVFHFDNLQADFDIILQVYSLEINTDPFKRFLNHFTKSRTKCFKNWGEKHIKINETCHTFEDRNSVELNFDLDFRLVGFLNVSKCFMDSYPAWMERWCVLNEKSLTFWRSPVDQDLNNKPLDTLVLIKTMKIIETNLTSGLYRFSFILLIDGDCCNSVKYFLAARTENEIYYWKKYLKYALSRIS